MRHAKKRGADFVRLPVAIMEGERVLRVVYLDDPRVRFCSHYNNVEAGDSSAVPQPVSLATSAANAKRFSL